MECEVKFGRKILIDGSNEIFEMLGHLGRATKIRRVMFSSILESWSFGNRDSRGRQLLSNIPLVQ